MKYIDGKLVAEGQDEKWCRELDEYITKAAKIYLENSASYMSLHEDECASKLQRFKELVLAQDYFGIKFEMSKIPYERRGSGSNESL